MKIFVYAEYNELRTEQFIVRQKNIVEHERNQSSNLYHFFFFHTLCTTSIGNICYNRKKYNTGTLRINLVSSK